MKKCIVEIDPNATLTPDIPPGTNPYSSSTKKSVKLMGYEGQKVLSVPGIKGALIKYKNDWYNLYTDSKVTDPTVIEKANELLAKRIAAMSPLALDKTPPETSTMLPSVFRRRSAKAAQSEPIDKSEVPPQKSAMPAKPRSLGVSPTRKVQPAAFRRRAAARTQAAKTAAKPRVRIGPDGKYYLVKESTIPFDMLLMEGAGGNEKNVHIEHLEDIIFEEGYLGAKRALNYIEGLRKMLVQGEGDPYKVAVKWDGAPAIICGTDPADGKFFVGTKSVFGKTEPKLCKSIKDINKFYGSQEGLAKKLTIALKYLPKLGIGNVLQGELMFTPGDIQTTNIDGKEMLTFTPNTITYAVPMTNSDGTQNELAQKMINAKIGIIFHTAYIGPSISQMKATYDVSVTGLNRTKDVWFDDATYRDYTGIASLTPAENSKINRTLGQTALTLQKIDPTAFNKIIYTGKMKTTPSTGEKYPEKTEFSKVVKEFINSMVRSGNFITNPTSFLKNFSSYYRQRQETELAKLKGGPDSKAYQTRVEKINQQEKFIADNSNTLLGILAIFKRLVELKLMIIKKLQKIEAQIGSFKKTDTGYVVTNPEGFVAIGHDGQIVKLVDRLEFSRDNFNSVKLWKNT